MSLSEIKRRIISLWRGLACVPWHQNEGTPKHNQQRNDKVDNSIAANISTLVNTISYEAKASREEYKSEDRGRKCREALTIFLVFCTVVGITIQDYFIRDQEVRQLRAYVFAKADRTIKYDGKLPYELNIPYINTGQTPAFNAQYTCWIHIGPYPLPTSENLRSQKSDCGSIDDVIEPGTESHHGVGLILYSDAMGILPTLQDHPEYALYVSGRIEYKDVFGYNDFSEYCYAYVGGHNGELKSYGCPGRKIDHN